MSDKMRQVIVILLLMMIFLVLIMYIIDVKQQTIAYGQIRDNRLLDICLNVCPILEEMGGQTDLNYILNYSYG